MPTGRAELARWLTQGSIVVDGHIDVPWRLSKSQTSDGRLTEDVAQATATGHFDWPRAQAGGLDAPFFSIYVPSSFEGHGAKAEAERLIGLVEGIIAGAPDKFAAAGTVAEVRANAAAGVISVPMGMENGAPLEGDLANVAYFFGRGIRYITLTHSRDNHLSDSSSDNRHTHGGLSEFGKAVVAEMNRVGVIVDVSHLSDDAFWQVLEVSHAPVLASHSSCRHFTPGWPRNMSDDMIRGLAQAGGVIMINFGSMFQSTRLNEALVEYDRQIDAARQQALGEDRRVGRIEAVRRYEAEHPRPRARVEQVADHIDHVVSLVGVDHVGLGSDFDGVESVPVGLADVSEYPKLVEVLLARGYPPADIQKILGGNALRVWSEVERVASAKAGGSGVASGPH